MKRKVKKWRMPVLEVPAGPDGPAEIRKLETPAEVAERYQVKPRTVIAWYRAGKIPAVAATGKVFRFDPAAVARALEAEAEAIQRSQARENMRMVI